MKKIFTLFFAAVLCIGNSWGKEVTIGSGDGVSYNTPLTTGTYYKCFTQQLYLASELTAAGASAGTITSLQFHSKTYESSSGYPPTTRTDLKVYIATTTAQTLTSFVSEKGIEVFSSPSLYYITKGGSFIGSLSTGILWNGTDNIIVTVVDNSNVKIGGGSTFSKGFKAFTVSNRGIYFADNSYEGTIDLSSPTSPLSEIPIITFNIEGTTPSPSISTSTETLNFGSYYPAAETASQTFNVTASNLTEDITLSTTATGVTITPNVIAKDDADLAGDGVEVTVTLEENYAFAGGTKLSVSSEGASTKEITLSATKIIDTDFTTKALNFISSDGYYIVDGKVTISSMNTSEKSMLIQGINTTKNANYALIEGQESFAIGGKFTGLKGKYKDEIFTIFSYSSYEGTPTSVVTIKEDADNSEILADEEENVNVTLIRAAFQKNMFNTFCVPFDISEGLIGTKFAGCDIITLASSAYNDGVISLTFAECGQMEAGQPYLINPKDKDISFTFNGCDIQNVASGSVETDLVDFIGIVNPTDLPQSKEILFMGQNNELFWPTEAGTLKGMRCYFKVNFQGTPEGSAIAGAPVRMSIIKSNGITTDLPMTWSEPNSPIIMYKNQLFIVKDNKLINISGQTIQ